MPFDISTASPVLETESGLQESGKFDFATAMPVMTAAKNETLTGFEKWQKERWDEDIAAAVLQPLSADDIDNIIKAETKTPGALWSGVIPYVKGVAGFFTRPFGVEPMAYVSEEEQKKAQEKHPVTYTIGEIVGGIAPFIATAPLFPAGLLGTALTFGTVGAVQEIGRQQIEESLMTPLPKKFEDLAVETAKEMAYAPVWHYSGALKFIGRPYASALTRAGVRGAGVATLSKVFGDDLSEALKQGGLITALSLMFEAPILAKTALGRGVFQNGLNRLEQLGYPKIKPSIENLDKVDNLAIRQSLFKMIKMFYQSMKGGIAQAEKPDIKTKAIQKFLPPPKEIEIVNPETLKEGIIEPRLTREVYPPGPTIANESSKKWLAEIRERGWLMDRKFFDTEEEAHAWLDTHTGKMGKSVLGAYWRSIASKKEFGVIDIEGKEVKEELEYKPPEQPMAGGMIHETPPIIQKWIDKGVTAERQAPIRIVEAETKIKDISGNVVDLPKGEEYTPYKLSNGKIWLHDGKNIVIESGQLQNLKNKNLVLGKKEFAPELKDVEIVEKAGLQTKFSDPKLQLPGGENYREILLTAPPQKGIKIETIAQDMFQKPFDSLSEAQKTQVKLEYDKFQGKGDYISSHWDESNVLAHLRMNDRITPDGKKVLFIEEIQSDWAKEARGNKISEQDVNSFAYAENISVEKAREMLSQRKPSHPLLKNWQKLALKQAIKTAIEGNYDAISWTTGEQQAERYDLSRHLDKLTYEKMPDGQYQIFGFKGSDVQIEQKISEDKLDTLVGKEIAQRIKEGQGKRAYPESKRRLAKELSGVDLKIGGEWAKNLYDKQIPNILKDLTGGEITSLYLKPDLSKLKPRELVEKSFVQPSLELTPEVKAKITGEMPKAGGLPAEQPKPGWELGNKRDFSFDPNSTENEGRFRLLPPTLIQRDSYFRRQSSTPGISYIMGRNKETGRIVTQAIRFNKNKITEEQAWQWWEENKNKFNFYPGETLPEFKAKGPRTLAGLIIQKGGIDPTKAAVAGYPFESFKEFGLLNILKKGGLGLDDVAKSLVAEGYLDVGEDDIPSDILMEKLKYEKDILLKKAEKLDSEYQEEYDAWLEKKKKEGIDEETIREGQAGIEGIAQEEAEGEIDKEIGGIKPPPKKPPKAPPGAFPPAGEPPLDPIKALNDALKVAQPLRGKLEKAYTEERAKRFAEIEQFINDKIDNVGGEEGYAIILSKLKGELAPEAKVQFEPIKNKLTEEQTKALYNLTWQHPYLSLGEKISAATGLTDLLAGEIPQPHQLVLLEEIYGTDLIKNILAKRALGLKIADVIIDIMNIPRAILATADMSAFLRQGVIFAPSHPIIYGKAALKTFKMAFSQKAFDQYFEDIKKDPLYKLIRQSGLAITDPKTALAYKREETFMSRLLQQIPIVGEIIKFSERAYTGFLNKLRVDIFKVWADELLSKGLSPVKDKDIFDAAAEVVNTFTGRGSMGQLNKITPALNTLFFSPRLITARFNALNPIGYINQPKKIRMKAIGDFAKFIVAGLSILALIKLMGGEEVKVEADSRSSDFGKIKIGNTRWDIWGGFQPWIRVMAQVITGERKLTTTGEIVSLTKDEYPFTTRKEVILRFIEGKFAPVPALINELISGAKTFTGDEITAETVIKEKFIPMYIQDITDAYIDGGLGRAIGVGLAAFFGVGTQTYQPKVRSRKGKKIRY